MMKISTCAIAIAIATARREALWGPKLLTRHYTGALRFAVLCSTLRGEASARRPVAAGVARLNGVPVRAMRGQHGGDRTAPKRIEAHAERRQERRRAARLRGLVHRVRPAVPVGTKWELPLTSTSSGRTLKPAAWIASATLSTTCAIGRLRARVHTARARVCGAPVVCVRAHACVRVGSGRLLHGRPVLVLLERRAESLARALQQTAAVARPSHCPRDNARTTVS